MAKKDFKPGELLAPIPAVMVSCGSGEKKNIITIAWTGIINSTPPMTYISVRKSRYSHDIISETGEFVINLTTEKLAKTMDWCGVKSGRDVDKFKACGLTPVKSSKLACPMIAESPVNLECKVSEVIELPSHDMFIAEIVACHVDEELINDGGKCELEKARLVSLVHGGYHTVNEKRLGGFGYSVMKPKTKKRLSKAEHEKRVANNKAKRGTQKTGSKNTGAKKVAGTKNNSTQ